MTRYKTAIERIQARAEQVRQAGLRRKAKRQEQSGILPLWKAAAMVEGAILRGYTFAEAWQAVQDVAAEQGLRVRRDINNNQRG